jgi:drug/metabolite transporter (DMT)-like permease
MITMGDVATWDNDPYTGFFGWMNWRWDRLGAEVWIVLICNLIGTMGFVRSMTYFDPILIAVATLLEPMIASMIAVLMKVGLWPTPMGWLGNALVIAGTLAVVAPSAMRGDSSSSSSGGH